MNEKTLEGLIANRELTAKEKEERANEVESYLITQGGIVIAASCQDGILLVGVSHNDSQVIYQVFHRIALLGVGRGRDCKDIHGLALASAYVTGLSLSKADINAEDITDKISVEMEKAFSYLRSKRGLYKADFIIAELGFKPDEDYLDMIGFCGDADFGKKLSGTGLEILERPVLHTSIVYKDKTVKDSKGNAEKDENGKIKVQRIPYSKTEFRCPVSTGLLALAEDTTEAGFNVKNIKEVALFVGLLIRLLDERRGKLEMVYLDRKMLEKTKSDKRRFHHIWRRITNPNPYAFSDPWQDWRKFVAPVYKQAKSGEITSKLKILIEFYEAIKGGFKEDQQHLLKKLGLSKMYLANFEFVMNLFGSKKD